MAAHDAGGDSDGEPALDIFIEPANYYPPERQPTTAEHTLRDGQRLTIRLVAHNPLWVSGRPPHSLVQGYCKRSPLCCVRLETLAALQPVADM